MHPDLTSTVLLGYVHSRRQHRWIDAHRLYNLRADVRAGSLAPDAAELHTDYILLYGRALPSPELWTRRPDLARLEGEALASLGYEAPLGTAYHVVGLGERLAVSWEGSAHKRLRGLSRWLSRQGPSGQPVATAWALAAEALKG